MKISNNKTFIVAELSANHQQKFDIAVETIKAIKAAGADAVKLQTYTPDTLTIDCDNIIQRRSYINYLLKLSKKMIL